VTAPISCGFHGRRGEASVLAGLVPPGQYVTHDFPVLSAGPAPHDPIDSWSFEIRGEVDEPKSWTWEQFIALPSERTPRSEPLGPEHGGPARLLVPQPLLLEEREVAKALAAHLCGGPHGDGE
jgi:DMSO/TMAO reductase YedYZ molybdopterin-dependent catalytic subunit